MFLNGRNRIHINNHYCDTQNLIDLLLLCTIPTWRESQECFTNIADSDPNFVRQR